MKTQNYPRPASRVGKAEAVELDSLPEAVRKRVQEGIAQADNGQTVPHSVASRSIKAKYPHVFRTELE